MLIKALLSSLIASTVIAITASTTAMAQGPISEVRGGTDTSSPRFEAVGTLGYLSGGEVNDLAVRYRFFSECTAVLISPTKVMTNAQCVTNSRGTKIKKGTFQVAFLKGAKKADIYLQDNILLSATELQEAGVIIRNINPATDVHVHPSFLEALSRNESGLYDSVRLAIIDLQEPIDAIKPAKLADADFVDAMTTGTKVIIAGYGHTGDDEKSAAQLQRAALITMANDECDTIAASEGEGPIHAAQICAKSLNNNRSACNGDAGAPLFGLTDDGKIRLVGIHNFRWVTGSDSRCSRTLFDNFNMPARVSDWVENTLQLGTILP